MVSQLPSSPLENFVASWFNSSAARPTGVHSLAGLRRRRSASRTCVHSDLRRPARIPQRCARSGNSANIGPSPYADWSGQVCTPRQPRRQAGRDSSAAGRLDQRRVCRRSTIAPTPIAAPAGRSASGREPFPATRAATAATQVGGGAACFGEGCYLDEGTWGWDYMGLCFRKRVALDWWHGTISRR